MIKKDNIEITLTKNEMIIFNYLLNHQDRIVSRDEDKEYKYLIELDQVFDLISFPSHS